MRLTATVRAGVDRGEPPSVGGGASTAGLVAGLVLVFVLDQSTGSAPVQHLYYLPIIVAAMRFGTSAAMAASVIAIALYHVSNPRLLAFGHGHWDFVQVGLFVAVGLVTAKLADDKRRLSALASTDDLTGLHNLRSFERRLATMIRTCRAGGLPIAILVLDLDRLKSLNDAHGHLAGAEAVQTVGCLIASQLPPDALACRYGGDEFVLALPGCTGAGGRAFADRLRRAVNASAPVLAGLPFPAHTLSVSVGVACHDFGLLATRRADADQGEVLFRAADRALYQAKQLGRNHVCVA